jgi:hypothetical protein
MCYDDVGVLRAVCAEALFESNVELAVEEKWVSVEWCGLFKIRPRVALLIYVPGSNYICGQVLRHRCL